MLKKPCIILSLVIAVCMFFVVTEGMAQTTSPPQTCTAGSYTISVDSNYFGVAVTSQSDSLFSRFPCWINQSAGIPCNFPYYVYQYNVSPYSGIGQIDQVLPLCDDPIQVFAASPNSSQLLPSGTYDSGTKWPANGLYTSVILKWAANPNAGKMWIATNAAKTTLTAMALKSGNSLFYCSNPNYDSGMPISATNPLGGIAGPGCLICNTTNPDQGNMEVEKFSVGNVLIETTFNAVTCEATKVQYSLDGGTTWYDATITEAPTIAGEPIKSCGNLEGNQKCTRCLISAHGSPGGFWMLLSNVWYWIST
jgi:hypothetical protein